MLLHEAGRLQRHGGSSTASYPPTDHQAIVTDIKRKSTMLVAAIARAYVPCREQRDNQ